MGSVGFLSEGTASEKMDERNIILAGILEAQGGSIKPTGWGQIQSLVRAGLAGKVFSIGDQLTCSKGSETLTWDVIGFDIDEPADSQFKHSMTLQLHDCYLSAIQFDAREAFYYAEDGLEAGTYYFTAGEQAGVSGDIGKDFQFTLAEAVPAGGQITLKNAYNESYEGTTVSTYESGSSETAIETADVTEGNEGTFLGTMEITAGDNLNSWQRESQGSNSWAESAMRQLLNSDGEAGTFWEPQTNFDRPPSWVGTTAGFMNGMDEDFLAVIGKAKKVTARNTVCDGGGSDITEDLFWLLSRRETYGGDETGDVTEGEAYPYYSDYSDLKTAGPGADTHRIKYRKNGTTVQQWWLRTPTNNSGHLVMDIDGLGRGGSVRGCNALGISPGCCII